MKCHPVVSILGLAGAAVVLNGQSYATWTTVGHDAQHNGESLIGASPLSAIQWSTPVDFLLAGTTGKELFIHYGSPIITASNTVLVPVRTTTANNFRVNVFNGSSGTFKYALATDYTPPPHNWIPSYGPALAPGRFYYAGAGGTVYFRNSPDSNTGTIGHIAFYGTSLYAANKAAFDSTVMVSTPIVSDASGNIFFGFKVTGSNPGGLVSGIARISSTGVGSWVSAASAAGDPSITQVPLNCTPALSRDGTTLYFAVNSGNFTSGYLVSVNAATLSPVAHVRLIDSHLGGFAEVPDDGSASPTVGPDGDVYYGVFEQLCCINDDRGWMLHFDSTLSQTKIPGAFGWDTTASIVLSSLVPSYHGTSTYLLFTKYNNYIGLGTGGNGQNKIAVLDPNATEVDPITGALVMQEVITILGPTPDPAGGVKEWCINSAAIDIPNKSAIVNSEDGILYRWDFTTNTLSQQIRISSGIGEAYTPTVIGPDGTAYAINDAVLYAVR